MQLAAIALATLALGFEQVVQLRYGPMGIVGFLLLALGWKARNATLGALGAIILLMLLTASG